MTKFTTFLIALALPVMAAATPSEAAGPGLTARWVYNPAERPAPIVVTPPPAAASLRLALMDHAGNLHVEPIGLSTSEIDLFVAVPEIRKLRYGAYLQLLDGETPIGSALVVHPMLSRLVPVTEDAVNPSGIKYTKIVGWRDEVREDAETIAEVTPPEDPWLSNHADDGRLFCGVRLYPERDVRLHTAFGAIHLALRPDRAPNTAWNFRELASGGFYRDIPFHRIVPMTPRGDPFVIQAGDPTDSGSGGPGYWLPMEPSGLPHDFGVISMARDSDPDSAGSQIFICLSRAGTARLDGHYVAFGETVAGAEIIEQIAGVELADVARGKPVTAPRIQWAELIPAPPRRIGAGRPDAPVAPTQTPATSTPERVPR